jgi:hypothetical protein
MELQRWSETMRTGGETDASPNRSLREGNCEGFLQQVGFPWFSLTALLSLIECNFFGNPIRFAKLGGMPHHSFFPDQPARRLG